MVGIHPICIIADLLEPMMRLRGLDISQADLQKIKNKIPGLMIVISEENNPPTGHSTAQDLNGKGDPDNIALLTPSTAATQELVQAELARESPIDEAANSKYTE
jgi:hypothetical protein